MGKETQLIIPKTPETKRAEIKKETEGIDRKIIEIHFNNIKPIWEKIEKIENNMAALEEEYRELVAFYKEIDRLRKG